LLIKSKCFAEDVHEWAGCRLVPEGILQANKEGCILPNGKRCVIKENNYRKETKLTGKHNCRGFLILMSLCCYKVQQKVYIHLAFSIPWMLQLSWHFQTRNKKNEV
jgi:hypothetical protein